MVSYLSYHTGGIPERDVAQGHRTSVQALEYLTRVQALEWDNRTSKGWFFFSLLKDSTHGILHVQIILCKILSVCMCVCIIFLDLQVI